MVGQRDAKQNMEASSLKRSANSPPNVSVLNRYWGRWKVRASLWNRSFEHILRKPMGAVSVFITGNYNYQLKSKQFMDATTE